MNRRRSYSRHYTYRNARTVTWAAYRVARKIHKRQQAHARRIQRDGEKRRRRAWAAKQRKRQP